MLYQQLLARREALRTEGNAIHAAVTAAGEWTEPQRDRDDAIVAEMASVEADITRMERQRSAERAESATVVDGDGQPAADAPKPFSSLGSFLQAVRRSTGNGAKVDERLSQIQDHASRMATIQGASESVPADGGFLVQEDLTNSLLSLTHDTGLLSRRARRVPIGPNSNGLKANLFAETSRANGSRFGAVRVYREGEADPTTGGRPKFRQLALSLYKLMGLFYATDELLQDATALDAMASQAFVEEFGYQVDEEMMTGSGAGEMLGILNAPALVSVAKETGQAAATILAENVEKMFARMPAANLGRAEWFINQECWPQIFQLAHVIGTGGVPMYIGAGGLRNDPFGSLLGRPVQPIEQAEALGTKGDIVLADWKEYLIIEKGGQPEQAVSIHVEFLTAQSVFRWILRNNGGPIPNSPITPAKGSSTVSPFVALDTRA